MSGHLASSSNKQASHVLSCPLQEGQLARDQCSLCVPLASMRNQKTASAVPCTRSRSRGAAVSEVIGLAALPEGVRHHLRLCLNLGQVAACLALCGVSPLGCLRGRCLQACLKYFLHARRYSFSVCRGELPRVCCVPVHILSVSKDLTTTSVDTNLLRCSYALREPLLGPLQELLARWCCRQGAEK